MLLDLAGNAFHATACAEATLSLFRLLGFLEHCAATCAIPVAISPESDVFESSENCLQACGINQGSPAFAAPLEEIDFSAI